MNTTFAVKEKLENILKGIKKPNGSSVANILLYKDYMTRMQLWYKYLKLDWDYKILNTREGHNLFQYISKELQNELMSYEQFSHLELFKGTGFQSNSHRDYSKTFIYLFIYWELFKDKEVVKKFTELPHPYESVIKIFLRGGFVRLTEKRYTISYVEIGRERYKKKFKLPSIENDFLDYIDSKCELYGSGGIPNQEKTNQLYQEFLKLKKIT